jgi:hypothetical protein
MGNGINPNQKLSPFLEGVKKFNEEFTEPVNAATLRGVGNFFTHTWDAAVGSVKNIGNPRNLIPGIQLYDFAKGAVDTGVQLGFDAVNAWNPNVSREEKLNILERQAETATGIVVGEAAGAMTGPALRSLGKAQSKGLAKSMNGAADTSVSKPTTALPSDPTPPVNAQPPDALALNPPTNTRFMTPDGDLAPRQQKLGPQPAETHAPAKSKTTKPATVEADDGLVMVDEEAERAAIREKYPVTDSASARKRVDAYKAADLDGPPPVKGVGGRGLPDEKMVALDKLAYNNKMRSLGKPTIEESIAQRNDRIAAVRARNAPAPEATKTTPQAAKTAKSPTVPTSDVLRQPNDLFPGQRWE